MYEQRTVSAVGIQRRTPQLASQLYVHQETKHMAENPELDRRQRRVTYHQAHADSTSNFGWL